VFDPWKPTTNFGGKKHPGSLAESTALAAIKMPVMKTKVHIPKDVIETGRPSESQLEAVAYIAQAHNTMLPGTEIRSAGALGDGTGSGKGITLASIILDNMMQGRKKALWISKNQDLAEAARLDWQKIGQSADDIFLLNDFKASDPVDKDTGILFTSYFTMAKDYKIPAKSRLQQIINWVGADFDGVLIFDESHIMGNANKSGRKEAAAVALAGIELQNALPNARIVYSSATMFTEVRNMLYAERLGLWGPTTSFPTKEDFINAANEGGVAFMEMISQNLKAFGKYIARSLSMNDGTPEGTVDYSILEHKLTDEQKTSYDIFAKTWSLIYKNMHTMFEHLGYKGRDKANAEGMFQSSVQRFFGQVLMALQAPAMIKSIQQDLKDGNSVLIQLTNTGDAAQERAIAERENEDDEIDVTPREMLTRFLDAAFPTTIMVESIDDMGNKVTAPLLDSQGKPVEDQEAVRIREKLKDDLGMVAFPENPLDMLINHFGPDMVAEVTSRKRQILRSKDGKIQIKNRGGKGANLAEQKAFQDGKKRIVIFSKAGGTGASYHADLGAKNQQKRIHYPFQPGWEANVFFQGLGRSHRTNQKQAPSYRLITTDLPGQRRFISTIARRMEQMGALTHGNRKATGGVFKSTDNLESKEALDALRYFLLKMRDNDVADISRDEFESATGLDLENDTQFPTMGRFLNRILALPFQMQVDVMNQYLKVLEDKIELGKASGQIDQGIENYKAEKITENQTKEVYHDPESGAKAFYHKLTATHKIAVREWRDVRTAHSFVVNKKSGNIFAVEDGPDKTDDVSGRMYKTYRLRGHGDRTNIVERAELDANRSGNWQHVSDKKEAEKLWDEGLKTAPKTRENEIHLISGASLPIYHKLGRGQPRVMRMMVGKKKLLGRIISADVIEEVLQNIGVANDPVKVSSGEAFDKVMNGNIQLILDNGWKIRKMMVGGQKRIVLDGPTIYHAKALANVGVFTERVGGALKTNFFIPATQEGLAAVTTERPIVRLMSLDSTEHMAAMAPYSNTDVPGGFTNTGNTAAPTIGKHEIVSDISRIFGVKIGFGNVPKGVGGRYRTFVETARIHGREAAILAIAAHEVAHHLDKKTSIRDLWSGQAERELQAMDYEPKDRAFEGFAEYIRRWTFGDETLKSTAPMFDNWFWTQWADKNPEWVSRLEQMKDLIDRYRNQTVLKQVVANIHFDPKQSDKDVGESTTAYLARLTREAGHRFYAQHKDQFHYLHRMEKDAIKQGYKPGPGNIGPYEKALTMFQSGASLANTAIEEGVFLIGNDGQKIKRISRGLREIFEPISPKERTDFTAYAYARSAIEAWKEGTNPGIEKAQAKAVYDQLHNEKWEAVAKEWTGFNDSLIVMMADAGVLSRETAQTIIASHKNYLPFMRSAEDVRRAKDRGAALLNLPNPLKRRFGSNLPIIDPVQATIERAVRFYSAAAHQTIMNSAANLVLKTEGMGKWGEVVAPGLKATKIPMTEVNEILEDMGFTIANMESGDKISQLEEHELDDLAYSFMTIYRPDYFYRGRKPIGRVFVNGQPKMFEWDKDIYRTLSGMDVVQIPWFVRILGKFTNLMKLGATGVSAGFAVGNLIRDYPAFLIQRKHATGLKGALRAAPVPLPGTALTDYIMSLWNEMRGGEGDPVVKLWKQFGGELAQSLGMDKKKISVTADQLFGKRSTATFVNMAKHPIDALRTIISVSEVGPRIAEFEAALAKQGYTREAMKAGQVPPLGVIIPAMNASKDVTLNFQRMGYHGRVLNQIFPYWNAQLEGVDKTVRTIKDDPKRAAISIAALVSAGIVYWMRVHDEDWYKESAPWLKYGTWVITDDEGNPIARLPRPHEWNWLFVASTEAFMNRWNDEDPKAVQEWISGVTSATLPGAWPSLITPLVEVIANKDLSFTGNPIVNDTLQELPAERQFTPQTTETAKAVGRWLGWSPAKIEHFVNRVSGGLYRKATVPVEGAFTGFDKYSSADLPVIGRFMMRNDYPASLNEFYAELDDLSKEAKAEKQDGTEGVAAREFNTMDRYRNVMSAMRDLRDKASKEEAVLIDRYRIGLARQALDKDRLERYPTPWKDENAPEAVQKEMARIVGSAAYQASAARPQRQMGESIDHYRERLAEHEKSVKNAEAFLDETGLEAVDIRPMMLGEMRRRGLKTANEGAARRLRSLGDDDSDR
jgi:putative sterol carrier protein